MTSSLHEQLFRDANKPGAYQAKLAYAEYLLTTPQETADSSVLALLDQIEAHHPQHWQDQANYLRSLYYRQQGSSEDMLDKEIRALEAISSTSDYDKLACSRLLTIFKEERRDKVKASFYTERVKRIGAPEPRSIGFIAASPEFLYKQQREAFQQALKAEANMSPWDKEQVIWNYIEALSRLLIPIHPELSDTLEAKIRFQLIRGHILLAEFEHKRERVLARFQYATEQVEHFQREPLCYLSQAESAVELGEAIKLSSSKAEPRTRDIQYFEATKGNVLSNIMTPIANVVHRVFFRDFYREKMREAQSEHVNSIKFSSMHSELYRDLVSHKHKTTPITDDVSETKVGGDFYLKSITPSTKGYDRVFAESKESKMTLSVKTLTGGALTLELKPNDTVADLKHHLFLQQRYPVDQQRLIFSGRQLKDKHSLLESGIESDATISLLLKLGGD